MKLIISQDIVWWTGVVWITCGWLWLCFYQMFGISFWLQSIHWWVSDIMLNLSKSVLMKKQTHLQPVKLQFLHIFFLWQYTGNKLNNNWHYKYWQRRNFNKWVFVDGHLVAAYDDAFSYLKLGGKNNISAPSARKPLACNRGEVVCLHTELDFWFLE